MQQVITFQVANCILGGGFEKIILGRELGDREYGASCNFKQGSWRRPQ